MKAFASCSVALLTAVWLSGMAFAQVTGTSGASGPSGAVGPGNGHLGPTSMTQDQFNQSMEQVDRARRLTADDKAKGKTVADLIAEDKAAVTAMVKEMPLSCEVSDAILAAQGPATVNGKSVDTKTYEAACSNGLGYFLVQPAEGKSYGFSCFAADATAKADVAAGRQPGAVCKLKDNADMKAMGASVLTKAGKTCPAVTDYRWVGQNAANHTEFDEFACTGGNGYMVISALPGAAFSPVVRTCPESAKAGLPCKYSDNGNVVTVQTFRDALAAHNVACDAADNGIKALGQENAKKRYVVEFLCPAQRPHGLVAFIPLEGSTAPFEITDCAGAHKKTGATCVLNK